MIYFDKNYFRSFTKNNILDSTLIRTDVILSLDDQVEEAYLIRARVYRFKGDFKQARDNFETALNINPNYALGLRYAGSFYINDLNDYVKGFSSLHKAASIDRSPYLAVILRSLAKAYVDFGFIDNAIYYNQEATSLDNDSILYYSFLSTIVSRQENWTDGLKYRLKVYTMDTNNAYNLRILGKYYMELGHFEESLRYYEKYMALIKARSGRTIPQLYRIGYVYWGAGYKEKAEYYFNEQIKMANREIEYGGYWASSIWLYYSLASIYAFNGDKDKAFENLRIFNQIQRIPLYIVIQIKIDPLLDNIRDEPEFQQIVRDVEAKYQAERERVRRWLEENDML